MKALAHRGHDALTLVTLAPNGTVVVSHRFDAHDLEPALDIIAPMAQPSLDDPDALVALKSYLMKRFSLASDGGWIALKPGKIDTSGGEVRVEFSGQAKGKVRTLTVRSEILSDVYPSQVNQVNVRFGDTVRTLTFSGGGAQSVPVR